MTAAAGSTLDVDADCSAARCARTSSVDDGPKERCDSIGCTLGRFLLRVEPREPEQVADQPLHAPRMAIDHLEEFLPLLRLDRIFHQRFDVSADRGQRRAQLVRDVRDEVAPHAIDPPQIADVVQHEHGAAAVGAGGRRLRAEDPRAAGRAAHRHRAAPRSAAAVRP